MLGASKTLGVSIHEVLYEMSFVNLIMYSSTVQVYRPERKSGKSGTNYLGSGGGKETFSGFGSFMRRMRMVKESMR